MDMQLPSLSAGCASRLRRLSDGVHAIKTAFNMTWNLLPTFPCLVPLFPHLYFFAGFRLDDPRSFPFKRVARLASVTFAPPAPNCPETSAT